jgi:hypothetical protein
MDTKELETWLETTEGQQWADGYKGPLIAKRDELLSEVKNANGKFSELEQRFNSTESELKAERDFISSQVIDKELSYHLKKAGCFDFILPQVMQQLKDNYVITVAANGRQREAAGIIKNEDGTVRAATLTDILEDWKKHDEAKQCIMCGNTGGGAPGSGISHSLNSGGLHGLSSQQIAAMPESEFKTRCQQEIDRKGL